MLNGLGNSKSSLKINHLENNSFFSIYVFFHEHSRFIGQQGKGEGICLTPLYHFHPVHRHLDISLAITSENSLLHIALQPDSNREPLVSERKLLTKLLSPLKHKRICLWFSAEMLCIFFISLIHAHINCFYHKRFLGFLS